MPDRTPLPSPLVPADVDLRDFAFMPLDVARLRDSDLAANETPEACWAAVLIWSASWHQVPAGSIPNDDRWIAKQAGYVARGLVAKEWSRVRPGALRGFIECSDSRLYHKVVAEKALDAWKGKLRQRLATECSRIKKHNQRHGTSIPYPEFDAWFAAGCPQGQPLQVPGDKHNESPGQTSEFPGDNTHMSLESPGEIHSKGQGEGQGEIKKTTHTSGEALPEGWALPKPWGVATMAEFPHWSEDTIRAIAAKFTAHHRAKATMSADWMASWQKWTRDELTQRAHPPGRSAPPSSAASSVTVPMNPDAAAAQAAAAAEAAARSAEIAAISPEERAAKAREIRESTAARLKAVS